MIKLPISTLFILTPKALFNYIQYMKQFVLYPCLRSHSDWCTQDQLSLLTQRLNGWFSVRSDVIDYWVPEDRVYMLYMIDSNLTRQPTLDYIV